MEGSPVCSYWSPKFLYQFIYKGGMGVTLNTAHDTVQTRTPVAKSQDRSPFPIINLQDAVLLMDWMVP